MKLLVGSILLWSTTVGYRCTSHNLESRALAKARTEHRPCDKAVGRVLAVRDESRSLGDGWPDARFVLVARGPSYRDGSVEFCIFVKGRLAYRQIWSSGGWVLGRSVNNNADSLVNAAFAEVLGKRLVTPFWFDSTDQSTAWGQDFQNAYAAAAFSLKQYDYRRAVGLPLALSLPGLLADSIDKTVGLPVYVRDSLYKAPVDSQRVRSLVADFVMKAAPALGYSLGGELYIRLVYDRDSNTFVLVRG